MSLDMRFVLDGLLPGGQLWNPVPDGDLDKLLDGMADNSNEQYYAVRDLGFLREPLETPILEDLEYEYGILSQVNLSESIRRQQLHSRVYAKAGFGLDYLQERIQEAGYDLVVQANDPAVDPNLLLGILYWMPAGGDISYAGYNLGGAILARAGWYTGGELVVNGSILGCCRLPPNPCSCQVPQYLCVAGNAGMYADSRYSPAGYFLEMYRVLKEYPIPDRPGRWPLIFFVAKSFSGWDLDPPVPAAVPGDVPNERVSELKRIILRHKPLHSWCGLIINYI